MRRALRLARRAQGRTWPNPMVGAVLVRNGVVVGEGYHRKAGRAHAEVLALDAAGDKAAGADLYVTLEPCHCHGRTPPCTDRIQAAGVARVFVGACDPNPRESGAGIEVLRAASIEVHAGVLEAECMDLNRVYNRFIVDARPFVRVKAACSLDGRMAPASRDARWISGKEARVFAHRLRSASQAVCVGVGTVLQDDPALDVRHLRGKNPAVVVLDSRLRTPPDAHLLKLDRKAPVWIYHCQDAPKARVAGLRAAGAELVRVAARDGRPDWLAVLRDLFGRGVYQLLVEGGAGVIGSLIEARLVDWLDLILAPCLLGSDGVPVGTWNGPEKVALAPHLIAMRSRRLGPDLLLQGEVDWPEGGEA